MKNVLEFSTPFSNECITLSNAIFRSFSYNKISNYDKTEIYVYLFFMQYLQFVKEAFYEKSIYLSDEVCAGRR